MNADGTVETIIADWDHHDLDRTCRTQSTSNEFYWVEDVMVWPGHASVTMAEALSPMSAAMRSAFKENYISFMEEASYSQISYKTQLQNLSFVLKSYPTTSFDLPWMSNAVNSEQFRKLRVMHHSFLDYFGSRYDGSVSEEALRLLLLTKANHSQFSNVLSDDPEKSWLTDEEYESLLRTVWDNYESNTACTQVTLLRLLSMQYARRPRQFAQLKIGDLLPPGAPDNFFNEWILNFPGVKDINAERGFRDSKFEPHPLPDHLLQLVNLQICEVKTLFESSLGFEINDHDLKNLPLFCSDIRLNEAVDWIQKHYQLDVAANLDHELFHLRPASIKECLCWRTLSPNLIKRVGSNQNIKRPAPPVSHRTGRTLVVSSIRMRHTRARQLARKGMPRHILSHWLGHTSENAIKHYYNDPAEQARKINESMAPALAPLAMAFTGNLIDTVEEASLAHDPSKRVEMARAGELVDVGCCGKHSFCSLTTIPIPCYRCQYFEPLLDAPHTEVLDSLNQRQNAENQNIKIGGQRRLILPIDLTADIKAVENCIARCEARKAEREDEE